MRTNICSSKRKRTIRATTTCTRKYITYSTIFTISLIIVKTYTIFIWRTIILGKQKGSTSCWGIINIVTINFSITSLITINRRCVPAIFYGGQTSFFSNRNTRKIWKSRKFTRKYSFRIGTTWITNELFGVYSVAFIYIGSW